MHAKIMHKAILGGTKSDIHNKIGSSSSATMDSNSIDKQSKKKAPEAKERASLDTLASIITMELGTGSKKSKVVKSPAEKKGSQAATTQRSRSLSIERKMSRICQETKPSLSSAPIPSSMSHHQEPYSGHPPALYAARMAQEQEALALYLQQRQQLTNLELERLQQLEHLRRMQAAMFLYGPASSHQPTALDLERMLLSHRVAPGFIPGREYQSTLHSAHPSNRPGMNVGSEMGKVDHSHSQFKKDISATAASVAGATPSLIDSARKRSVDLMQDNHKRMKARPEEYQHLSKKAKNTPLQRAVARNFGLGQPLDSTKTISDQTNDLDKSENSEDGENGHRFRPYQYEQWTEKFQELCDFRKEKGHCQVPHTYSENPPLARWVKRQRYQYKLKVEGKMSTMTDERVKLLEDIGFIWDSHAAAWAEKLHELKDYLKVHGDCNVPSTYPRNPQLATWVKCQRRQYKLLRDDKLSNMTVDRIMELEKLGFVWEVRKTWDQSVRSGIAPPSCRVTTKAE